MFVIVQGMCARVCVILHHNICMVCKEGRGRWRREVRRRKGSRSRGGCVQGGGEFRDWLMGFIFWNWGVGNWG